MSEVQTKPSLRIKGRLMSASEIERTLVRLAHEVVEKSNGSDAAPATIDASRALPLRCRTSHGKATMLMPFPAAATSAANRSRCTGPRE